MMKKPQTQSELKTKIEFEYIECLKSWNILKKDFSFVSKSFHNIHLLKTIKDMECVVSRLQMLSYLLEKWDDN
jgi:hypothetical protein